MSMMDVYLYGAALVAFCGALGIMSYGLVSQKDKPWDWGGTALSTGFAFHTASLVARWIATGHVPTVGNYENASIAAWFIVGFTLWFYFNNKEYRAAGLFVMPVVILTMGFGLMSDKGQAPMVASLKTFWLYVHIFFAWIVTGAMSFAAGASVMYLIKEKQERTGTLTPFYAKLPPLIKMDELIYRNVVIGFICYAVMIGSGALWGKDLWGAYWGWDPVETWSLVSWLIYGLVLHLRFSFGMKGRATAWLVIFALITVFIVMFGVNLMMESSRHVFNVK